MTALAIDRFRQSGLPAHLEAKAQRRAAEMFRADGPVEYALLFGYLEQSVALALRRPRWRSQDQLAVDLRTVEIAAKR